MKNIFLDIEIPLLEKLWLFKRGIAEKNK